MNVPSLLVIFIGGWGLAPRAKSNLLHSGEKAFLEDLFMHYPATALQSPDAGMVERYRMIGHIGAEKSLLPILLQHEKPVFVIADPERYGLITTIMHGREDAPEGADWRYIEMPPYETLRDEPGASLPKILKTASDSFFRKEADNVFLIGVSNLMTAAQYKNLAAMKEAVQAVEKTILKLTDKALENKMRVLIVSDSGMAEDFIDLEKGEVRPRMTSNPLPCVLVDRKLEGMQARNDLLETIEKQSETSGSLFDLAPTILALMGVPVPKEMEGEVLFDHLID